LEKKEIQNSILRLLVQEISKPKTPTGANEGSAPISKSKTE
jgi:hypothetical protein